MSNQDWLMEQLLTGGLKVLPQRVGMYEAASRHPSPTTIVANNPLACAFRAERFNDAAEAKPQGLRRLPKDAFGRAVMGCTTLKRRTYAGSIR